MSFLVNPYVYQAAGCSGDTISTLNLGGYWKFDNDYTDSSGNGHTLTPVNSPSFTGAGYYNEAVLLTDATNDYLSVAHSADFNSSGSTWSLSAWIYINSFAGSGDQHIYSKRTSLANGIRIVPRSFDVLISCGGNYGLGSGVPTGQWVHFVATRNGTTVKIFLDTVQQGTSATISGTFDTTAALYIGTNSLNLGTGEWDGMIDDYSIWQRELTSDEITDLYNSTCPLKS